MGRILISGGFLLIVLGLAVTYVGRLPGDIRWQGKHGSIYVPVVACLVISVLVSLVSWFFRSR